MDCSACYAPNTDGARFCAKCGALLPIHTDEADPLIGAVVGARFRITGILGEGGMGRVYTGEQQMGTSVRKVAVKTLLAQYARDPQVVTRFMRECGTTSELEHPNTIKVYDYGQTDTGELYIAMELLTGKSLETALEQGPLPPERVDRILGQICGSLQEAHDKGIVHRDLKPANIYLSTRAGEEDYVKVLDFGIAKPKEDKNSKHEQKLTQKGTVLGTPPYMSPEQFRAQELDARSDIYSLAVMAYEMLTGRLPFDADTPWAWASQHMTAQPFPFEMLTLGNQLPAKMKAAVLRALSKDKAQRQQSAREFYEEFTLGTSRMSALGGRSSLSDTFPGSGGMASAPGYPGGGQTQLGEPIFTNSPQPAGYTVVDDGAHPAIPPNLSGAPAHQQVPTGSGQVFAPPPPTKKRIGAGRIIAVVAVAGVVAAAVTAVLLTKKEPVAHATDAGVAFPATSVTVVGQDKPEDPATAGTHAPASDAKPKPTGNATGTGPKTEKIEKVDPKAEQECKAAVNLATGNNIALAINHYRNCDGPGKVLARTAIDQAALRVTARGCNRTKDALAAAQIGASSALNRLRARNCPGVR
jgi:serine/threonine-protein kinase